MPKINKLFELDVTPEKFLEACTIDELKETILILNSRKFQYKLNTMSGNLIDTCKQKNKV